MSNLLENWKQKLISLILAVAVWAILRESIEPGSIDQILSSLGLAK
ncbi:conserved protein of unknown function [Methylacidimicrobium sp. AP8]|nr:hypothetical protein [Methylacidimicrobium sp. AP8]CAB4244334.1 conserved protein of unknown function [Methylacidimicrobium sp. AP8]